MFICENCHQKFEEPERLMEYQYHSELDPQDPPEKFVYEQCPHCGDDHFQEATQCPLCGEYHTSTYALCPDCQSHVSKAFSQFLEDLTWERGYDTDESRQAIKDYLAENAL